MPGGWARPRHRRPPGRWSENPRSVGRRAAIPELRNWNLLGICLESDPIHLGDLCLGEMIFESKCWSPFETVPYAVVLLLGIGSHQNPDPVPHKGRQWCWSNWPTIGALGLKTMVKFIVLVGSQAWRKADTKIRSSNWEALETHGDQSWEYFCGLCLIYVYSIFNLCLIYVLGLPICTYTRDSACKFQVMWLCLRANPPLGVSSLPQTAKRPWFHTSHREVFT